MEDGRWKMDERQIRSVVPHPSEAVTLLPSVVIAKRLKPQAKRSSNLTPPKASIAAVRYQPPAHRGLRPGGRSENADE